jgi:hypothetical protein
MNTKKIITKMSILLCGIFIITSFAACNDAEYSVKKDVVFLSEAQNSNSKKIILDDKGGSASASIRISGIASKDIKATLGTDAEVLNAFNKRNGTSYELLSPEYYSFSDTQTIIKAGTTSAPSINLTIEPLPEKLANSGKKFAIPVTIKEAEGNELLSAAKSMVYILDQVIITNAPIMTNHTTLKVTSNGDVINTTNWTVEYSLNSSYLPTSTTAQGLLFIGAGSGVEIYFRLGDAAVPGNLIMIKTQGSQFISTVELQKDTWYHFAWVHDGKTVKLYVNGKFDTQMDSPGKESQINTEFTFESPRQSFMWSEFRLWSVARSEKQIQENRYACDPAAEGLEIYLKMNEGQGRSVIDYANKHGISGEFSTDINWKIGIRSDGK